MSDFDSSLIDPRATIMSATGAGQTTQQKRKPKSSQGKEPKRPRPDSPTLQPERPDPPALQPENPEPPANEQQVTGAPPEVTEELPPEEEEDIWPDVPELLPIWMTQGQPESVIKSLQDHFKNMDAALDFPKCPVVDDSVYRLLPEFPDFKLATARDRGLMSTQFKLLDVVKPLLMLYRTLGEEGRDKATDTIFCGCRIPAICLS